MRRVESEESESRLTSTSKKLGIGRLNQTRVDT